MQHGYQKEKSKSQKKALGSRLVSRYFFNPVTIILFLITLGAIGIVASSSAQAADMKPTESAESYVFYNSLTACIKNQSQQKTISGSDALAVKWFKNPLTGASNPTIGYFLDGAGTGLQTTDNGNNRVVGCGGDATDWITAAAKLWGYDNAIGLLCDMGANRMPGGIACLSGGDADYNIGTLDLATFQKNVSAKIGGTPSLSPEAEYALNKNAFMTGCLGPDHLTPWTGAVDEYVYENLNIVDSAGASTIANYYGARKKGDSIAFSIDSNGGIVTSKCGDMAAKMNSTADDYKTAAVAAGGDVVPAKPVDEKGDDKSCGAQVAALGWIICPIINGLTTLNDAMWSLVSGLLFVSPIDSSGPLYNAWGSIRSIANVVFVAFFLIIILSQLSGAGISNYGVKKLLPKIIVAAILVNLSFIIVQVAVDLANVIGYSLYNLLQTMTPKVDIAVSGWGALVKLLEGVGVAGVAATGVLATIIIAHGVAAAFWMLLPIALMAALGLLVAVLTLIFRQAVIPVLAILAPLAFVAYLLPNTESWFKKWLKLFMSMLMMFPLAAVVFGGAQFAAYTIISQHEGKDFWELLIGLIILTMPLFSLPFLARQGGPLLTKVGGAMKGVTDKARAPLSGFAKSYQDKAKEQYKAGDTNRFTKGIRSRFNNNRVVGENSRLGRTGLGRLGAKAVNGDPLRRATRWMQAGKKLRAEQTETAKKEFESQIFNDQVKGVKGSPTRLRSGKADLQAQIDKDTDANSLAKDFTPGGGRDLHQQVKEAQGQTEKDKQLIQRRYDTSAEGIRQNRQLGVGALVKKSDDSATAHRIADSRAGQVAHQASSVGQGRTAVDAKGIEHRYSTSGTGMTLDNQLGNANLQGQLDDKATAHRVANDFTIGGGAVLHHRVGEAELVASVDKNVIATGVETDRGLLDVRMGAATAQKQLDAAKAQTTRLVTEASTEGGRAAAVASGVDNRTVDTNIEAQRKTEIAASALQSAQRVQHAEYAEAVAPTTAPGTPMPITQTARDAAGIGGAAAIIREQAKSRTSIDTQEAGEVNDRAILIRSNSDPTRLIDDASAELGSSITTNDRVGALAATKILFTNGTPGRERIAANINRIPAGDTSETTIATKNALMASGIRDKDVSLERWSYDPALPDLATVRDTPGVYANLTPEEISTQSVESLTRGIGTSSSGLPMGITPGEARATLDSDSASKNLTGPARILLEGYATP